MHINKIIRGCFLSTFIIVACLIAALAVVEIVTGFRQIRACNFDPMLPVWLIVMGVLSLMLAVGQICMAYQPSRTEYEDFSLAGSGEKSLKSSSSSSSSSFTMSRAAPFVMLIIGLATLAWFIYGQVILSKALYNADRVNWSSADFCRPSFMQTVLVIVVLHYVLMVLFLMLQCCLAAGILNRAADDSDTPILE